MTRLVAILLVAMTAAPAAAQVINGETPLDETTLNRETPGPAVHPRASAPPPSPVVGEPARSDPPPPTLRHD